jgi:hypothetical protein
MSLRDSACGWSLFVVAVLLPMHTGLSARGDLVDYVAKPSPWDPVNNVFTGANIDAAIASDFGITGIPPSTHDVIAFKIRYETVDAVGAPTTATALVTIPLERQRAPTFCYNHGTTPNDLEVPSESAYDWNEGELFALLSFSGAGYVGIAADYVGMGAANITGTTVNPGYHPYHHAPSQAAAVVDAIRAGHTFVRQLEQQTATTLSDNDLFLTGYSQGGHVTMCAHREIEENPTLGLSVRASVPAAGAYDLGKTAFEGNIEVPSEKTPLYLVYIIHSYHRTYSIPQNLHDLFVPAVAASIPDLLDGTKTTRELVNGLPPHTDLGKLLLYPSVEEIRHRFPDIVAKLEENSMHRWVPKAPMLMLYVDEDVDVLPANTFVTYGYMAPRGAPVRKQRVGSGFTHNDVGIEWIRVAREYFDSFTAPSHSTYEAWKSNLGNFHRNEIDAGEAVVGPNADPNRDGVSNLVCYALGLEPMLPAEAGLPRVRARSDGKMELSVIRRINDPSLAVVLETTNDLKQGTWTGAGSVLTAQTPVMMGGGFEQTVYTTALPASDLGKRFFRVRIQR